jgi:hypothetical protein
MGFFSFMETSFFFTLGITFLLILLLVYHFKQRITNNEQQLNTMFELVNNVVQEINNIKASVALMNRPSTPYPHNYQNTFKVEPVETNYNNDEPDEESYEDDSDLDDYSDNDDDDDDEKVIVSDNEDDDISVEEISITENDIIQEETQPNGNDIESIEVTPAENIVQEQEEKPDFNKMNLGNLKAYILKQGWVEDASKMKKAQILTLIQERAA